MAFICPFWGYFLWHWDCIIFGWNARRLGMRICMKGVACLAWMFALAIAQGALAAYAQLTLEDRVRAQEAVERVYYNHRIWPKENPGPKPPFEQMISGAQIEAKVEDYLKKSAALEQFWQRPITAEQLQAEMDRMANQTKDPDTLKELFAALNNDPYLIAECLARPILADRLIHNWYAYDTRFHAEAKAKAEKALKELRPANFRTIGGQGVKEVKIIRHTDVRTALDRSSSQESNTILLDDEAFEAQSELFPPPGTLSAVCEAPEAFFIRLTESKTVHLLKGCILVINKQPFGDWLTSVSMPVAGVSLDMDPICYSLPHLETDNGSDPQGIWSPLMYYVPEARYFHTAVWTGTEMIIWGGYWDRQSNTGGRYNPATDSWLPTSTDAQCPSARENHTAVWTGSEMIIWGSAADSQWGNTGGRYNPLTDSWLPTSTGDNCPSGRSYHSAVWTGTEMIIWGGIDNTGGRYDPRTDTWRPTSTGENCPTPMRGHTAVWTGTVMIVWDEGVGGRYNPITDTWAPVSTDTGCPSPRFEHTAVWTGSLMLIWGGTWCNQGSDGSAGCYDLNTGGGYDPVADRWYFIPHGQNCPSARSDHTAVWTGTEMIIWGGDNEDNTGGRYNLEKGEWTATSTVSNCPLKRAYHTVVWTGKEMIVWGGDSGGFLLNTGGRYNPASDSWLPTSLGADHPSFRSEDTAIWTGNEMILWGGYDPAIDDGADTGWKYQPAADSWFSISIGSECPSGRRMQTAVWSGAEMIIWGGQDYQSSECLNSGGRYNPVTDHWMAVSEGLNCPSGRIGHASVWTGTEMIIWGGNYYGAEPEITGGRYDPLSDTWLSTSTDGDCPSPRQFFSSVWTGKEMIIWGGVIGGVTGTYLHDGGGYDPSTDVWRAIASGTQHPPARAGHTAVWTGNEMIVWGGSTYWGVFAETGGRYNPTSDAWTTMSTAEGCPVARDEHTAVWTGKEMIIWGGREDDNSLTNSGGFYFPDSDRWLPITMDALTPSPRVQHMAVWTGKAMIVWGPKDNGGILNPPSPHTRPVNPP